MFKTLDSYSKEKEYLIAIDSDGCVFDNMTVKHQKFFFPNLLKAFSLSDQDGRMAKVWDEINLDYPTRGINRFKGLALFFKSFEPVGDPSAFYQMLQDGEGMSNERLALEIEKTGDPFLKQVLAWSQSVNTRIQSDLKQVEPFKGAIEGVKVCSDHADIVVVSSANQEAVMKEWKEAGLLPYVRFMSSQDVGSKEEVLETLLQKGYDKSKILMIGDARGDYAAAKRVGAHYYQISYQKEVAAWQQLQDQVLTDFVAGLYQYDGQEIIETALEDALEVLAVNVDAYADRFQHVSVDGVYPKEENKLWTMSFYPGQLYLAQAMTKDDAYVRNRKTILDSFRQRCHHGHMATHDIGFLFELTAYYDYLYCQDESSRALVIEAADKLMLRYHKRGGFIQAWGPVTSEAGETRIIIDCMMNLPLLYIASELTGDNHYKEAAISHAKVSGQTLLRPDGSTYHTYWMDNITGEPLRGATHQGHKDDSTWARGQAWSLYGFFKSYEHTMEKEFLEAATRSAQVFLENIPKNDTCYWDFDFDHKHPDIKDTSAASIAAAGLLKLSSVVPLPLGEHYYLQALSMMKVLANQYQNNKVYKGCGILREGMYHRDEGYNEFTSWGDYYFVEALSTILHTKGVVKEM